MQVGYENIAIFDQHLALFRKRDRDIVTMEY